ncbi:hypothetical protein LCGC14_2059180, partial [marine sediment metagenome]
TDWGTPAGDLNNSIPAFGFALKENTIETTDWKMFIREPNLSTNTGTMNHGAMVVWGLSTIDITSTQFTRLTGSKILSPDICADTMTVINSGTLTLDGGELVAPTGTFSTSLTISGVPVATGTAVDTLQDVYDAGDGTISTTGGKPFELTGTGELTAVTGTFTTGLTVGGGSTNIFNESITTGSGIFTDFLTVSGIPVDITGGGGGGAALTVKETDGAPSVSNVNTIVVTTGTLTDDGGGQVTIVTGGGSGGIALTVEEQDGTPSVANVNTIKVTNATLTNEGGGVVSIDTGGSGGGGGEGDLTFSGAPTFLDPVRYYNPMIRPRVPFTISGTNFDDNFNGDGEEEIDTGRWTVFDPAGDLSVDPPKIFAPGDQVILRTGNDPNGSDFVGIFQSSPDLLSSFNIFTKVGITSGSQSLVDVYAGIMFLEDSTSPTTSNILLGGIRVRRTSDTPTFEMGIWEFSAYNVSTPINISNIESLTNFAIHGGIFLKFERFGSGGLDRWDLLWSLDGITGWRQAGEMDLGTDTTMATFDAIGLGQLELGGFVEGSVFSYFRTSAAGSAIATPGDFVYVERDPTASGLNISGTITGGGGSGNITDINAQTGPSITIDSAGLGISVITEGNTITVSGITPSNGAFRGAVVHMTTATGIVSGDFPDIYWDTEILDTDDFFDSSPGLGNIFTIPAGVTKIRLGGVGEFANDEIGHR